MDSALCEMIDLARALVRGLPYALVVTPIRNIRKMTFVIAALTMTAATLGPVTVRDAAAEPWTLERALDVARTREPEIVAAHAAGDAGRADARAAFSALSPRLSLEANAIRTDDPAILFTEKLWQGRFTSDDFALEELNDPAAQSALDARLVLDVPIWNGGVEITAPSAARQMRAASNALEDAAVAHGLLGAVETFVGVARARGEHAADSLALAAADEARRAAAELYRQDQVPEADTLRAAARWGEARIAWLDSSKRLAVSLSRLSRLVGEDVRAADVVSAGDDDDVDDDGNDAASASGADERGELRAAGARARLLAIESKRAGLRLLPALNSRASVSYYRPWDDGDAERRWTAGIAMTLPLWDGTRRAAEWKAARSRAAAAAAERDALERDLAIAAESARGDLAIARERCDVASAARAAAEEALRLARGRYHAGLLPIGELLFADTEAARARHNDVNAASEVVLARYRYLHAIGELR
ncbi:MAG: TolC family protein [bacterium]